MSINDTNQSYMVNINRSLDHFIEAAEEEGIIDEDTADKLKQLQIVIVRKTSFSKRIARFFGWGKDKDDDEDESGYISVVKVLQYQPKPDDPDNEDANDFLKRKGIL